MKKIDTWKFALKSSSETMDVASKVKNIERKIRMPMRIVTFVQPLNDVTKTHINPNGDIGGSIETSDCTPVSNSLPAKDHSGSFADILQRKGVKRVVKVKELRNSEHVDGADVAIPMEAVKEVSSRFDNTLYGYFIGHRLAFPLVEGMESVMENGPWLIRRMPLMLNVWTPNTDLKKEEIKCAPLWVKLHHVPIVAYLKGHTLATVEIEYEWKPPRCSTCVIFDHMIEKCPNNPIVEVEPKVNDEDGLFEVKKKKHKVQQTSKAKHNDGLRLNKPSVNFYYRKVEKGKTSKTSNNDNTKPKKQISKENVRVGKLDSSVVPNVRTASSEVEVKNSSSSLGDEDTDWEVEGSKLNVINESDSDDVDDELIMYIQRRVLWNSLGLHKHYVRDRPWCILGDFNAALFHHDSSAGNSSIDILMHKFKEYVEEIEVMDVQHSGLQFTWSQKPKGSSGLLKKIDRIMANLKFTDIFTGAHAIFKPYRISDHAPSILNIPTITKPKSKPFKFYNIITSHEYFKHVVLEGWSKQLREGDSNLAYFYKACKSRVSRSRIDILTNGDGVVVENDKVVDVFVSHYEVFLGQSGSTNGFNDIDLFRVKLDDNVALDMTRAITNQEEFLRKVPIGFGFHSRMIGWIMEYVTTTSFSISINGSLHGLFKGKHGLQQGDPLSPYLFTLIMEILTLMLQSGVRNSSSFNYHIYCANMELINLCFMDDLFLFANGDVDSVRVIKDALFKFNEASGVPLVSSHLIFRDCQELIEKVQARVDDWKNKSLSAAGRLCEVFFGKAGLRLLGKSYVFPKMRGDWAEFWDIPLRGKLSWGWRKILQLRPSIRDYRWYKLGDGSKASLWFDKWCMLSPLSNIISHRDMYRAGLSFSTKVQDVLSNGVWEWPIYLLDIYPMLISVSLQNIDIAVLDQLQWRNELGFSKPFSVSMVWSTIRHRNAKVDWCNLVWFASCIPRHAFNLWLVVKHRLKTQDNVARWDVLDTLLSVCPLCELVPGSHEHLFFKCSFSQQIWDHMKGFAGLNNSSPRFSHIMSIITPFANRKTTMYVIAKPVLAASAYFIWQERNGRLFKNNKRMVKQVIDSIFSSVRLKLLSCCFKKSKDAMEFAQKWSLPDSCFSC
uniref:Reverse transcriptase domain-containing protein n=1 Tax=Tanacetum cinerariifolium TaxID=118510 RepID=A0A6L2J266_TANCI|nr:hypothetical protein [Tanacetum cinerariifolium]